MKRILMVVCLLGFMSCKKEVQQKSPQQQLIIPMDNGVIAYVNPSTISFPTTKNLEIKKDGKVVATGQDVNGQLVNVRINGKVFEERFFPCVAKTYNICMKSFLCASMYMLSSSSYMLAWMTACALGWNP